MKGVLSPRRSSTGLRARDLVNGFHVYGYEESGMFRRSSRKRIAATVAAVVALVLGSVAGSPSASAANGDLVQQTNFGQSCGSGIGVGIAFDGTNLWYSCYASSPDLFKANPLTGAVISSYTVAGGLGALAW